MTTPLDPYAASSSNLPSATQNMIPGNAIGANSQTINTSEINLSSSGGGAVLGYAGTPTAGNLTFSLSSASGTDTFGNSVPTGLSVGSGSIIGLALTGVQVDSTSTLQGTTINNPSVLQPSIAGGTAASLSHTMTNTNGNVLGYTSGTVSATFATNGNYLWTCPTGVTTANIQCWAAGAGGGGGSSTQGGESGGGGEFAQEPNYAVTPGQVYPIVVGQGGAGGATNNAGSNGGSTSFQNTGGGNNVTANGGSAGNSGVGGNGGSGSTNTVHFDGGDGANASGNTGGAGGAGSGSAAGEGNNGNQSSSSSGASGASGISGGGAGGAGGNSATNGSNGGSPGGAGGGAGANTVVSSSKTYNPGEGGTFAYRGPDANTDPNALINHDGPMFQGYPNATYGTQYSYWILPYAQIQSDMAGLNITSVSMKIKCLYSYYSGGVYAHVWYTSLSSFGSTGNKDSGSPVLVKNFAMTENETTTQSFGLNGAIGTALQSGAAKSIQFNSYPPSGGLTPAGDYYGSFDSGANNGVLPALVVYYNNGGGSTAGTGSDGQVIISYGSSVPTFQLSVSAVTTTDLFGNPVQPGFQGPLLTLTNQTTTISTNTSATSIGSNTAGTPVVTNSQGFTGQMAQNQTDTTLNAQTGTSPAALSKAYSIPGGDPQVGTVYKLSAWGDFHVPASTNGALTWQVNFGGSVSSVVLGGAAMISATFYEWYATAIVQFTTIGTSGAANSWIAVNASQFGVNEQFTIDTYGLCGAASGNVRSTLTASTMQLQGFYSGTVAAQTVRCFGSMLERMGP
jgi:hypothetical protein